ncbi:MAG TPA: Flp family type IVb pilin [Verrucomicrobiae bacterium]|nr:Flp family type IVb pilin [Verrucomicrobiae bacterium]
MRPSRPRRLGICRHVSHESEDDVQNILKRLWQDEQGQDLVEYALLLVLIALTAAATVQTVGTAIQSVFTNSSTALSGYTT